MESLESVRQRNRRDFFQGEISVLLEGLVGVGGSQLVWAGRKWQLVLRKSWRSKGSEKVLQIGGET